MLQYHNITTPHLVRNFTVTTSHFQKARVLHNLLLKPKRQLHDELGTISLPNRRLRACATHLMIVMAECRRNENVGIRLGETQHVSAIIKRLRCYGLVLTHLIFPLHDRLMAATHTLCFPCDR